MKKPIGIYVHIPFCASKCPYCDFYSKACMSEEIVDKYTDAVVSHFEEYSPLLSGYSADTIYFGGGTPTYIGAKRLKKLLAAIKNNVHTDKDAEITLEANPDSSDKASLKKLRKAGFNRISFGVQSANDDELVTLGRIHDFNKACEAVQNARVVGFNNISLDLMYGFKGSTIESTLNSLDRLTQLEPQHISTYALKLEEGTPMFLQKPILPDDDTVADIYMAIVERLQKAGYEQYEISNFAKDGYRSKHNSKYWDLSEYLGIGASAHSYLGGRRFSYVSDINQYINGINSGDKVVEVAEEKLDCTMIGEYVMLRLRTADGIDPNQFFKMFKRRFDPYSQVLDKYIKDDYVLKENGRYRLTPKGFFVSNSIITEVLLCDDNQII